MSDSCPVCGSANTELQGDYRGVHPAFLGLKRARCLDCEMVFATPMPGEQALEQFNASYFSSAHGGKPHSPVSTAFFAGIARLRAAHLDRYVSKSSKPVSRVLELGPGPGFFARDWMEKHPATQYLAVETDSSCHASLKKIGVHILESASAPGVGKPVDLVVMSHVLEHVSDPVAFLSESTRNLRSGGVLFIEVPCRDWEHKSLDEPHLLFFDKAPMKHLLGKLSFTDIQTSYHGQEIDSLRGASGLTAMAMAIRSRIIAMGIVAPFGGMRPGLECLSDPLERAVLAPYRAHRESQKPAWWLRALATKQ
ncbi:MAG: class I SAM-dependent methyltransferase [Planctomycetes bacterium]|nr:class I SAM-dependent methyltransferase [Planctomycetota bacterium]